MPTGSSKSHDSLVPGTPNAILIGAQSASVPIPWTWVAIKTDREGHRWISDASFLVPLCLLVELATGMTLTHARLSYQSLPGWKRALIMIGIFLCAAGAMVGGIYLFIKSNSNF